MYVFLKKNFNLSQLKWIFTKRNPLQAQALCSVILTK